MSEESNETSKQETIVETNGSMTLEEQAVIKAQLEEEQKVSAETKESLAARDTRIAALEADISARDAELAAAREEVEKSAVVITGLQEQNTVALEKYRSALVAGHPEIPESLISGDSFEALFDSVEKGKAVVSAVSDKLKAAAAAGTVPAGAPERAEIALDGLSPREKISAGIKPK